MKRLADISLICVVSLAFLPVICAQAEDFLVNWEGAYLDQNTGAQRLNLGDEVSISDGNNKVIGVGFPYSEDTAKSPASPHYDSSKPCAVFYGAVQVVNPKAAESNDYPAGVRPMNQVAASYGKNAISIGSTAAAEDSPARITGLIFWTKNSFRCDQSKPITWKDIQQISTNIVKINSMPGPALVRFAVRNEGKWYLSESSTNRSGAFCVNDPDWGEWVHFGTSFPLPDPPVEYATKPVLLNNISAAGVYFDVTCSAAQKNAVFSFNSFQIEAIKKPGER